MLGDSCDAGPVQRPQLVLARERGNHLGEFPGVAVIAFDVIFEIGRNFEQFVELGIELTQQVVNAALADQDDFDVERNGFRFQGRGADDAQRLAERFDADDARGQAALQFLVGVGLHQQFAGIENQVAAVGAVQRAGAQQAEIGQERAHLGQMFGAAHQIGMCRMVLVHHRRAAAGTLGRVIDQDVDFVAAEEAVSRGPARHRGGQRLRALRLRGALEMPQKQRHIVDHVGFGSAKKVDDRGLEFVGFAQRRHLVADGNHGDFAVEAAQFFAPFLVPFRKLLDRLLQLFLKDLDFSFDFFALFFR